MLFFLFFCFIFFFPSGLPGPGRSFMAWWTAVAADRTLPPLCHTQGRASSFFLCDFMAYLSASIPLPTVWHVFLLPCRPGGGSTAGFFPKIKKLWLFVVVVCFLWPKAPTFTVVCIHSALSVAVLRAALLMCPSTVQASCIPDLVLGGWEVCLQLGSAA